MPSSPHTAACLTNFFFTRLGELGHGDLIKIEVQGKKLNYRVTTIHVVKPNDVHLYRVVPGKDLVTLMTCARRMASTRNGW